MTNLPKSDDVRNTDYGAVYDVVTIGETMLRLTPDSHLRLEQADSLQGRVGTKEPIVQFARNEIADIKKNQADRGRTMKLSLAIVVAAAAAILVFAAAFRSGLSRN